MGRLAGIALALLATSPLAAQWSVGAELGMVSFSGTSVDTTTASDPGKARPSPAASYALRVERRAGRIGAGIGVLYSKGGAGVANGSVAVDEKGVLKFYEIAPEVSFLVARPGGVGSFRLHLGFMFDRWDLKGGTVNTRLGAHTAASLSWPLVGQLWVLFQGGAAVSAGVFSVEDLPDTFARRATWRRSVSAGVRVRF